MPLVFVHGVATRQKPEYVAEVAQRDALFRRLVLNPDAVVLNPDWGSQGVAFSPGLPWLPKALGNEAFGVQRPAGAQVGLSELAQRDAAEAVDLAVAASLDEAIEAAANAGFPEDAAGASVDLCAAAAAYLEREGATDMKIGVGALNAGPDEAFLEALSRQLKPEDGVEAFGPIDALQRGLDRIEDWVVNAVSDGALSLARRPGSAFAALFLGDVFVYLRNRDTVGADGVRERLFKPILEDLVAAAKASRSEGEPFVVIGHSLGGVILYDLLSDQSCLATLQQAAPGFKVDLLVTVGSQPGFFADLQLYADKPAANGRLDRPGVVDQWLNVFDFTDVFSFLAEPMFNGVEDFSYDSVVGPVAAHTAYFKRPSFYQRLRRRLRARGFA